MRNLSDESQMQRHVNIFLRLGSKMKDNLRKEYRFKICQQLSFACVSSKVNTIFVRVREVKNVKKTAAEAFLLHEHDRN